ncbi:MAG TPA: GMP/IMP nucleotidase [Gammaproteobacteria bacterium]|nr:GMP/IMP nucleotidase [Gammaproteobacteria bacterium]
MSNTEVLSGLRWRAIDTVLLDMDGTLLDLYFDSYLWRDCLPRRYAERHNITFSAAEAHINPRIKAREGTLKWYCLDHWTQEFGIDISGLEYEHRERITVRPQAREFLHWLRTQGKQLVLTTNAHRRSLDLKLRQTGIGVFFDEIFSAHDFGAPKEEVEFWRRLQTRCGFQPARSLLVDDNPRVLRSARNFGIAFVLGVHLPDSRAPARSSTEFPHLEDFREIMAA